MPRRGFLGSSRPEDKKGRDTTPRPSWHGLSYLGRGWRYRLLGGRVQAWLHWGVELLHLRPHRGRIGHVLELTLAVLRRAVRPTALLALMSIREVHEPIGNLEELQERDEAVAMQMEGLAPSLNYATRIAAYRAELMRREVVLQRERMEELTANLVVQIEQMETLNDNLNRLLRIVIFSIVVCVLVRRVRP